MNREVVEIQVRAVLPLEGSFAVFLGNAQKTFVIYVDEAVGTTISMFMRGVTRDRPVTHDLLGSVMLAFGAKLERVIINHVEGSVFHARMILSAENELHQRKVVELDARPSDSIAMAVQLSAPLFVASKVFDEVEDVSSTLAEIEKRGLDSSLPLTEETPEDDLEDEEDSDDDEDDDDMDDLDELDELDLDDLLKQDEEVSETEAGGYDDGYQNLDDDDDEGEEWKKADN